MRTLLNSLRVLFLCGIPATVLLQLVTPWLGWTRTLWSILFLYTLQWLCAILAMRKPIDPHTPFITPSSAMEGFGINPHHRIGYWLNLLICLLILIGCSWNIWWN